MTDSMPRKKINPEQNCEPCVLCGQTSYHYYANLIHWSDSLRENSLALENINLNNYIGWNCEKPIKNDINKSIISATLERKNL